MRKTPRRPVTLESADFDAFIGDIDPALRLQAAHDTAAALLARIRAGVDQETVDRLLAYTRAHGVDEVAELWSAAPAHTLPGALWRLYAVHASIVAHADTTADSYRAGVASLATIDEVVAGARTPTGPDEIRSLADDILRGAFTGDFATALDRASAFCRISAHGLTALAFEADAGAPERATQFTDRAHTLSEFGRDFAACATLARNHQLT